MNKLNFLKENAPCYLYDENQIIARCRELQAEVPQAQFLYSIKSNPFAPVVKTIAGQNYGADAASSDEVLRAIDAGIPSKNIFYSAPGKTELDLVKTMQKCTIIFLYIRDTVCISYFRRIERRRNS